MMYAHKTNSKASLKAIHEDINQANYRANHRYNGVGRQTNALPKLSRIALVLMTLALVATIMPSALTALAATNLYQNSIADAAAMQEQGGHIIITGDNQDFHVTQGDNQLFNVAAMLPGEHTDFASLTIENTQALPFTISIAVDDVGSDTSLLVDYLNIIVKLDGSVIADFPAKGEGVGEGYVNPYPIGMIPAGTTTQIEVGLEFTRGAEAENVLQENAAHIQWIITATSEQPTNPPIDPDPTDPTDPVDPEDPDPTDPTDPVDPKDPDFPSTPKPGEPPTTPSTDPGQPTQPAPGGGGATGGAAGGAGAGTGIVAAAIAGGPANVGDANLPVTTPASPNVPATNLPELTNIDDDSTPLAPIAENEGRAWALWNLIFTAASAIVALVALLLRARKSQDGNSTNSGKVLVSDSDDDDADTATVTVRYATGARQGLTTEDNDEKSRRFLWRLVGLAAAVLAIVLFLLTEDITLPMRMVDQWTLAHVFIFLFTLVVLALSQRAPNSGTDSSKVRAA
ncbi:MAG: hypothetical protein LBG97_06735 [Coriobacteriales bacterium]|jgi:hypothetical protein|nr:hypothetical protein [Coriobacteriales bacterium]